MLSTAFLDLHPSEAARVLEGVASVDAAELLAEATPEIAVRVLAEMIASAAGDVIAALRTDVAAAILAGLTLPTATKILRTLEPAARHALLEGAAPEVAAPLRRLLTYPEGTAGAVMDPRAVVVAADVSVREAIDRLRRASGNVLYYLYIVDRDDKLVGVVNIRELMVAPAGDSIGAVARKHVARLLPDASHATVIAHPKWRDVHAMPVADASGTFLGAVRYGTFRRLEAEADVEHRGEHPAALLAGISRVYWTFLLQVVALLGVALAGATRTRRGAVRGS